MRLKRNIKCNFNLIAWLLNLWDRLIIESFKDISIDIRKIDASYSHLLTDERIDGGLKLIDDKIEEEDQDADLVAMLKEEREKVKSKEAV